jgi:hypothetical protein
MTFEYKTVGAPEKGKRQRGARSQSDRVAAAFDEVLQGEAVDGWEYLRTDLLPVTERLGWFARGHEVHRAVMVFRRSLDRTQSNDAVLAPAESAPTLRLAPSVMTRPASAPEVSADPDLRLTDIVRGPGNHQPEE